MMKKITQLSCLVCGNSSLSVKKFKITEEYGGGNTIRYDLTNYLGYQIEAFLRDEDVLCSNCMNFFEFMVYTKRRLTDRLKERYNTADVKDEGFKDVWTGFTKFAGLLAKRDLNNSEDTWATQNCSRPQTPSLLIHKYSEEYNPELDKQVMDKEYMRSQSVASSRGFSETDGEVRRLFRRKRRGHNWSKRKGEQKSRALSRSYDCSRASSVARRRSISSRCTSTMSRPTSKRQKRVIEGKPLKTRSVSRVELSYVEEIAQIEAEKFYCDEPDCPLYLQTLSLDNYTLHKVLDHQNIARYNCSLCPNVYFTSKHLEIHNKVHDEKMYCFQCGSELEGMQQFQDHVNEHQIYSVNCLYCLMSFLSKKDLADHVATYHKKEKVRAHEKSCKIFESVRYKELSMRNSNKKHFQSITLLNEGTPSPQISDVDFTSQTPIMGMPFTMDSPRSGINFGSTPVFDEELDISDMEMQETNEGNSIIYEDSVVIEEHPVVTPVMDELNENIEMPQDVEETEENESIPEHESHCIEQDLTDEGVETIKENEGNGAVIEGQIPNTLELSIPRILDVYEINEIILGNRPSSTESQEDNLEDWQLTKLRPVVVLEPLNSE